MTTPTQTIKATCLCTSAAHEITLSSTSFPLPSYFCTCTSCRHLTGTLFLSTAFLPPSYEPSPSLLSKLTSFAFSNRITQYFCKRCGSTMLAHCLPNPKQLEQSSDRKEANWDVMTGTLESFDGVIDLKGYEYIHDTLDGGFSDFMPSYKDRFLDRWQYDINEGAQLPLYWQNPSLSNKSTHPDLKARLHAHCKCAGISFYIARPSLQSTQARRGWPDLLIPHYKQKETNEKLPSEPWHLRASNTKFLAGLCACTSCRLASGMEITAWAFVPAVDISLDAAGEIPLPAISSKTPSAVFGTLQTYNSSPGVARSFCSTCGAIVFWSEDLTEDLKDGEKSEKERRVVDVAVGLLAADEGARAENWLEWWTERLSFREDAVERAGSLVGGTEEGSRQFREKGLGKVGSERKVVEG
jgi:hypothetical protein